MLLPIWSRYADGFVFRCHDTTDGTVEYLRGVAKQYNILEILDIKISKTELNVETKARQHLFDTGYKYSRKIICLDADEYLDGTMTRNELESHLEQNIDTTFFLQWVQYTGKNTRRTDGPWRDNYKDRIGEYSTWKQFDYAQRHSSHLPLHKKCLGFNPDSLFIAHVAWLDKLQAAIKQYYWKVTDYATKVQYGVETYSVDDYDKSVNNFKWEETYIDTELKIPTTVFKGFNLANSYRLKEIASFVAQYSIPNLGDWGYSIHNNYLYVMALQAELERLK